MALMMLQNRKGRNRKGRNRRGRRHPRPVPPRPTHGDAHTKEKTHDDSTRLRRNAVVTRSHLEQMPPSRQQLFDFYEQMVTAMELIKSRQRQQQQQQQHQQQYIAKMGEDISDLWCSLDSAFKASAEAKRMRTSKSCAMTVADAYEAVAEAVGLKPKDVKAAVMQAKRAMKPMKATRAMKAMKPMKATRAMKAMKPMKAKATPAMKATKAMKAMNAISATSTSQTGAMTAASSYMYGSRPYPLDAD